MLKIPTALDRDRLFEARQRVFYFLSDNRVLGGLTLGPVLALFTFINLLPVGWAVTAGFFEISAFSPVWEWNGFENHVTVLTDPEFWIVLWRSVIFAGGSVAVQLPIGIGLALLVNRSFRGDTLVRALVMLPYLVPTVIIGFVSLWMANSQYGIINQLLLAMGLIDEFVPWYGNIDVAMIAVILTNSWKFTIFVTIMVLARLQGIPDDIYEAAEVMGATTYQKFRDITLPNLKGVIFIVLLLRGVLMFNKFDIIWVLTSGGPQRSTTTAPIFMYKTAFQEAQLGKAAAISTLLFVMLAAAAIVYFVVLEPAREVRVE